jgi:hypothetical protein
MYAENIECWLIIFLTFVVGAAANVRAFYQRLKDSGFDVCSLCFTLKHMTYPHYRPFSLR